MELGAPIYPLPKAPQQSQQSSLSPPPPVVHQPPHAPPPGPPAQPPPSPSRFSQSAIPPHSQPSPSAMPPPPPPAQSSRPVQPPQPPPAPSTAPVLPPLPIAPQPHPNTPRRKAIDPKGKGKATAISNNSEDEEEADQGGPFTVHVHRYAPFTGEKQKETLAAVSKALDGLYAFAKENNLDPTVIGKCFNQQLTSTTKMSAWQAIQRLRGAEREGVGKCLKA